MNCNKKAVGAEESAYGRCLLRDYIGYLRTGTLPPKTGRPNWMLVTTLAMCPAPFVNFVLWSQFSS